MSSVLPLDLKRVKLPYNYVPASPRQFFRDFVSRLKGGVSYANVLLGTTEAQNYNAGPYVNEDGAFYSWNPDVGEYRAMPPAVANSGFEIRATAETLTDNREINFPDKSVTLDTPDERIAMLIDVYAPRDAFLLPTGTGGLFNIDPTKYEVFYGQLHENITLVNFVNGVPDGKTIIIGLINDGTSYTVNWPDGINWPGGTEPTQPAAIGTGSGIGIYRIRGINNGTATFLYGTMDDLSPGAPSGQAVETTPQRDYGGAGNNGPAAPVDRIKNLP